ncbi:related to TFB1 - subunit of RNA polymerase II transcription initiation factor TFIIH [Ustilago trichophora]|uniref:Related to TFB1 - subunit of RNA polymerase II transcription initiation factor TFIIH n=1 Tax=Ustilago trichophora TaxID=86804 RepID=A0A5C3EKY8_9BASI|nr:related to TFB1 - subunit of RNA polymerase II transcription initiation factor TFIIH [Ustilago trichophora]
MSASSSSSSYMHAAVAFNKVPGTLSLQTDQTVRWVPSSASSGVSSFQIKFIDIAGLQTSKAGAAQIALMLVLANGVQIASKPKVLLVFNAAQQTALDDREKFKNELAAAVGRNRASVEGGGGSATPSIPPSPAAAPSPPSTANATRAATPDTRAATPTSTSTPTATKPSSTAASPAPTTSSSSTIKRPAQSLPPRKTDIELRISVIKSNPTLRALHKDIVISGQMSDAEFWSHPSRQRLLRSERAKLEQRAGRNARLADPKPTPNEAGELKLSITPELIRDLFEQFPVVARAYEENVPSKLDEGSFWTRYFQSKLYHRLRTSARSAASEHIVQDDAIFDQYLEEEDNQLEPRRVFNPHDRLLDLGATEEDHGETGNGKDWTMRAGAERRTLPLMRRFNDHSQSLLDSALGDQEEGERRKRRRIVGGVGEEYAPPGEGESGNPPKLGGNADDMDLDQEASDSVDWIKSHYYKEIILDDLTEHQKGDKVRLNMVNLEGYLSGASQNQPSESTTSVTDTDSTSSPSFELVPTTMAEYLAYVERFTRDLTNSSITLGSFKPNPIGTEKSMSRMLANLRSRSLNPRSVGDLKTLPDTVQKSLVSLQASTTEFLRQFWNAIAPGPVEIEESDQPTTWSAQTAHAHARNDAESVQQAKRKRQEKESEAEEARLLAARKMALNLAKFQDKLESLLNSATTGLDEVLEQKVLGLLVPTQKAVNKAVGIARSKGFIA